MQRKGITDAKKWYYNGTYIRYIKSVIDIFGFNCHIHHYLSFYFSSIVDMFAYDNMVIVIENCALQFHRQPKKTITCCLKEQEMFHFQKCRHCVTSSSNLNLIV